MSDAFLPYTFRLGRGINVMDASALMQEGQVRQLDNWRITGQGRLTPRKALVESYDVTGHDILAIIPYPHKAGVQALALTWGRAGGALWGRELKTDGTMVGTNLSSQLTLYASQPTRLQWAILNQVIFIADTDQTEGMICYDPQDNLGSGATPPYFQPTFDFDSNASFGAMKAKVLVEFKNHLWTFGHGDETTIRGDYGRFSYLGLLDDAQGSGDAGVGGATGSEDLFDVEDFVPVCGRGETVNGAIVAGDVLVYCTENSVNLIYGYDRNSWRREQLESQRGLVNGDAITQLDGVAYGWSEQGPWRYVGGGVVERLETKIQDLVEDVNRDSVIAVAQPRERQVRWYYRTTDDTVTGANKALIYDVRTGEFLRDEMAVRVFCAGHIQPGDLQGPAAHASALSHDQIDANSARAHWTPGDTSSETTQIVYRAPNVPGVPDTPGTWVEQARYDGSVGEHFYTGLASQTKYWTKVETIRNGAAPATGSAPEASFTTEEQGVYEGPPVISVEQYSFFDGSIWRSQVNVILTQRSGTGVIQRQTTVAGTWETIANLNEGQSSYADIINVCPPGGNCPVYGTSYDYRAANIVNEVQSGWSNVETITPTDPEA